MARIKVFGEGSGYHGATCSTSTSEELKLHINVMFLCDEWVSSKGGLSTFNREFAVNLAKTSGDKIKVHCYVSKSNEQDREDARKNGVKLIPAKTIPGNHDPLDWLKCPPPELPYPDIVIGHGRKFGTPAYCIVRSTNCKWVQFVHVYCEDLGKYKQAHGDQSVPDTIEENEKKHKSEVELCKAANAVVAVGSRLQQKYNRCLPDTEVQVITPGILENFSILPEQNFSAEEFSIFVFGRGTFEDLALKGYDIIANAIGSLGEKFNMTFVGSPKGEHRNIEAWFRQETRVTRKQVTIRGYCDQNELKMMFHEADLVALPSRTEGFGLVALEAISAGIPVLVTSESGIAKALEKVEGGESVIVRSEKPENWSRKILQLARLKAEERRDTAIRLREKYNELYSWETQCKKFTEMIQRLTNKQSHSVGSSGSSGTAFSAGNPLLQLHPGAIPKRGPTSQPSPRKPDEEIAKMQEIEPLSADSEEDDLANTVLDSGFDSWQPTAYPSHVADLQAINDKRIQRKDIVINKQNILGKGSYGIVYKGTYCGASVAVKELHVQEISEHNLRLFEREITVAAKCHHPNLVHLMGFIEDQGCLSIVMELLKCNLRDFIRRHKNQRSQLDAGKYLPVAAGIAGGLCCLHKNDPPIIHRDIKSDNILLKRDGNHWMAKIGDYGTAKLLSQLMTPNRGTSAYAAPEAQTPDQQSPKMDVYSFGKVLLEMATYQRPEEGPCSDLIERVKPEGLKKLIVRCTAVKPQGRPTMEEVLVALNHLQ